MAGLRAGALGLPSLLVQGVTHIAPAVGLLLSIQYITQLAGPAAPLCYAAAFVLVLLLGLSLTQLARCYPSAGGYYTYVSRTVHPRAGFLTAWVYFLYDPTSTAINLAFAGHFFQQALSAQLGLHLPWWLFFLLGLALVTFLVYRGVEVSAGWMALFCVLEIGIILVLCALGLFRPGPGGLHLRSFSLKESSGLGFYLGVVFSLFCFTGFESVAPLAEESRAPHRNLPRAIVGAILLMGAFYVFSSWALLIGWGTERLPAFVAAKENPALGLARARLGGGSVVVLVAVANSILAVCLACTLAATRVFFAMGRAGALPRLLRLDRLHPRYLTPVNAIWLQTVITLAVGLGLGFLIGPAQEFYFMGVALTLGLIFVYGAGNLGVMRLYLTERRAELRPLLHLFCPLCSTLALCFVGYKSVVPLPEPPVRYAPLLVAAWLLIGVLLSLTSFARRAPENRL